MEQARSEQLTIPDARRRVEQIKAQVRAHSFGPLRVLWPVLMDCAAVCMGCSMQTTLTVT
jgi:hypothetical protein